jgi:hypothetical protein
MIAALKEALEGSREHRLYLEFELAKRLAEASSLFVGETGRFPLTGRGDVNTYALFAELFSLLVEKKRGRAGVIVPTGIALDETTSHFFRHLTDQQRLMALYSFYEIRR